MIDTHLLHHYQRLYSAKPSREIAATRARAASASVRRRSRSSADLARHRIAAASAKSSNAGLSSDDERARPPLYPASSMSDLWPAPSVGTGVGAASSCSNVSDRIDVFLSHVRLQQHELDARRRSVVTAASARTPSASGRMASNRSSESAVPKIKVRSKAAPAPARAPPVPSRTSAAGARTPSGTSVTLTAPQGRRSRATTLASRPPTARKAIQEFPLPDTRNVQSRLKADRNYQPPRRSRPLQQSKPTPKPKSKLKQKAGLTAVAKQSGEPKRIVAEDYEDDFEKEDDDEEEEEEEDLGVRSLRMTRRWVDDQVARGVVRQKAVSAWRKASNESHDKASSQDSAYGFSGGESRLQTREPTPETVLLLQKRRIRQQQQQQQLHREAAVRRGKPEDTKTTAYVNLVNQVTSEILRRGVFTDKAVRDVLEKHVCDHEGVSRWEAERILSSLRKELGLETRPEHAAGLKDLLFNPTSVARNNPICDSEMSDHELADLLHDADLDDSTALEVMRAVRGDSAPNPKDAAAGADDLGLSRLVANLNISDLNISFNASNTSSSREKRSQQRQLLIKSFAQHMPASRPRSAVGRKSVRGAASRPISADRAAVVAGHRRNDSSSSNTDAAVATHKPSTAVAAVSNDMQLPETPLHSSESPSSLYQPETEDDEAAADKNKDDGGDESVSEDIAQESS